MRECVKIDVTTDEGVVLEQVSTPIYLIAYLNEEDGKFKFTGNADTGTILSLLLKSGASIIKSRIE